MSPLGYDLILALAPPSTQPGQKPPDLWVNLVPILLVIVVFYVALIRPQQKKAKEHSEMVKSLKRGDKVITNGGIVGIIVGIKEKSISLRSEDAKVEVLKSAITDVTEKSSSPNES